MSRDKSIQLLVRIVTCN